MSRIRTIKPEFFKHETLFDAEQEEGLPLRLAFAGLWTCCDREGRFEWRPRALKTDIMPYDDVDFSRVLDALVTRGFVVRYRVDGRDFGHVPGFSRHQVINGRETESKLPGPPQDVEYNEQSTRVERVTDASATRHDLAHGEGKGREGERKGKEEDGGGGSAYTREAAIAVSSTDREAILLAIGADPVSGLIGPNGRMLGTQADMAEAERWLALPGMTLSAVCEELRQLTKKKRDGPPASFRYFTSAMERLSGALTAPALTPAAATGTRHDPAQFDRAINQVADALSAGTAVLRTDNRDPFAVRSG